MGALQIPGFIRLTPAPVSMRATRGRSWYRTRIFGLISLLREDAAVVTQVLPGFPESACFSFSAAVLVVDWGSLCSSDGLGSASILGCFPLLVWLDFFLMRLLRVF